ncbi:snare-complex protein syntaxin-18 N-terminus-domain-containing protein [Scheffersomyces xylosifermentans]|uniref:snare-complex protein syntaxin-18 N-terminus-domain-containing protein n=1 Tax=Scheffersomyces xylosifermentans TaxID=1304137 RepID=UPI00315DA0B3
MTDLTPLFQQCVEIVQSELGGGVKDDLDSRQVRKLRNKNSKNYPVIKDTFDKECYEFYNIIADLNQFVAVIKSPYLAVNDEPQISKSALNSLSVDDKNRIDEEFKYKIQQLYKKLSLLQSYEAKRNSLIPKVPESGISSFFFKNILDDEPSDQRLFLLTIGSHREKVLTFLMQALDSVNKSFEVIQKKRNSREKQLESLNFQNFDEDEDLNYNEFNNVLSPIASPPLNTLEQTTALEQEEQMRQLQYQQPQYTQQQLSLLETENKEFLTMKTNQLKQVEKVQSSIVDIINIQNELSFKLQTQGEQINSLMDNNDQVQVDVQMGNKTLNKATSRNKRGTNMIVTMCIIMGFLILFVDRISF